MKIRKEEIYKLVRMIPAGKVGTYGRIAKQLGISPRQVGYALHRNPDYGKIPCHRVVFSDGKLSKNYAFGGFKAQKRKLIEEKVEFNGDRVKINYHLCSIEHNR